MLPADDSPLLSATGISKHFGGLAALSDVSITVRRGEICGLIGPNGAGKTTLFNILTGIYAPDAGELMFDGVRLTGLQPHRVAAGGGPYRKDLRRRPTASRGEIRRRWLHHW